MDTIIGHEDVKRTIKKLIEEDKVGHAYLFTGKEGIGKKLVAVEFAKQIMTMHPNDKFTDVDYKLVEPENDLIKVEEIRGLINEAYIKPTYSKRKVIIIDEADKMNISSQNALLKVLEEPPLYITLILITSSKEKIIRTILSRVTEIKFNSLSKNELEKIVGDSINLDFARGSAKRAISLINSNYYDTSKSLIELFEKKNFIDINKKINEIKSSEEDITKILEFMKVIYYQNLKHDTYKIVKVINLLDETIRNLGRNANMDLALDRLIIKICEM